VIIFYLFVDQLVYIIINKYYIVFFRCKYIDNIFHNCNASWDRYYNKLLQEDIRTNELNDFEYLFEDNSNMTWNIVDLRINKNESSTNTSNTNSPTKIKLMHSNNTITSANDENTNDNGFGDYVIKITPSNNDPSTVQEYIDDTLNDHNIPAQALFTHNNSLIIVLDEQEYFDMFFELYKGNTIDCNGIICKIIANKKKISKQIQVTNENSEQRQNNNNNNDKLTIYFSFNNNKLKAKHFNPFFRQYHIEYSTLTLDGVNLNGYIAFNNEKDIKDFINALLHVDQRVLKTNYINMGDIVIEFKNLHKFIVYRKAIMIILIFVLNMKQIIQMQ